MDTDIFQRPDLSIPDITLPNLSIDTRDYDLADWQYEKICEEIKEFQSALNENEEVALQLTNFGQSFTMLVTDIGFQNPSLIYYYGEINGKYCQLIQHVSQINFLLMAVPKADPEKPARRVKIGFVKE